MKQSAERTVEGTTIEALVGDLTTRPVDAVVNAANVHLRHGGGVAGAIARAAGPAVQRESDAWVEEHGPLQVGQAAVTGAGELPARYVVHVAGPVYGQGEPDDETHLRSAVSGALDATPPDADAIAFPAISAGIYGYPAAEATTVISDEIVRWVRDHPGRFARVELVAIDDATRDLFARGLAAAG